MRLIPSNAQHIGKRSNQQDAFGFSSLAEDGLPREDGFVAVLADGMGGMELGGQASRLAVAAFLKSQETGSADESTPARLLRALQEANRVVHEKACEAGVPEDMGTTLAALAVRSDGIHWISVGDSAVFLHRDSKLIELNLPHTYSEVLDAQVVRAEISPEEAAAHPERESLTSYLGGASLGEVDRSLIPLKVLPGDQLLLASDGLFKSLSLDRIEAILDESGSGQACEALVRAVLEREEADQDNLTVLSVEIAAEKAVAGVAEASIPRDAAAAESQESVAASEEKSPEMPPQATPKPVPKPFFKRWQASLLLAGLASAVTGGLLWLELPPFGTSSSPPSPLSYPEDELLSPRGGAVAPDSAPPVVKGEVETDLPAREAAAPEVAPGLPQPPTSPSQTDPLPKPKGEPPKEPPRGDPKPETEGKNQTAGGGSVPSSHGAQKKTVPFSDGVQQKTVPFSDGVQQRTVPFPDGTQQKTVPYSDGAQQKTVPFPDGAQQKTVPFPDGAQQKTVPFPDGARQRTVPFPDGARQKTVPFPDGARQRTARQRTVPYSGGVEEKSVPCLALAEGRRVSGREGRAAAPGRFQS